MMQMVFKIKNTLIFTLALASFSIGFLSFESCAQTTSRQAKSRGQFIPSNLGYGTPTKGGIGGKVIKVTNLNVGGPGSFKDAIRARGPRIIVFEVAGVIDLAKTNINITEPYVTIAGQTAPSPGITLIKAGINIRAHDVIVQHIKIRPGDAGQPKKSGFQPDGLSTIGSKAYNIIVDHCSITWSVDESLSASGARLGPDSTSHNITFSNNIIAEGLYQASHLKGVHSMGTLVHDFVQGVTIIGNFYSCNNQRNPFFKAFTRGAVINNLIYNPGIRAIHMNWSQLELAKLAYPPQNGKISVVGNVMYAGVDTKKGLAMISGKGDAFVKDNLAFGYQGTTVPVVAEQIAVLQQMPTWPDNVTALPASAVKQYVLQNAGARPKDRDAIDSRIIDDFLKLKGHRVNSQNEVGGYPNYKPVYRKLVVPATGIEQWLAKFTEEVE